MPRQLAGAAAIARALDEGAPVRLVLACRERAPRDGEATALLARAEGLGVPVRLGAPRELDRMSKVSPPAFVLALVGDGPEASMEEVLARRGAAWLLTRVEYGTNAGFAIRTAEVAGADGFFIDAKAPSSELRRTALRASIRADRFLPVHWRDGAEVAKAAKDAGRRVVGVEDVGDRAPWEAELTGPVLLVVGGEKDGIPRAVLDQCDVVVRIPMLGFIPSYNLQAAVACVATERLRQQSLRGELP